MVRLAMAPGTLGPSSWAWPPGTGVPGPRPAPRAVCPRRERPQPRPCLRSRFGTCGLLGGPRGAEPSAGLCACAVATRHHGRQHRWRMGPADGNLSHQPAGCRRGLRSPPACFTTAPRPLPRGLGVLAVSLRCVPPSWGSAPFACLASGPQPPAMFRPWPRLARPGPGASWLCSAARIGARAPRASTWRALPSSPAQLPMSTALCPCGRPRPLPPACAGKPKHRLREVGGSVPLRGIGELLQVCQSEPKTCSSPGTYVLKFYEHRQVAHKEVSLILLHQQLRIACVSILARHGVVFVALNAFS